MIREQFIVEGLNGHKTLQGEIAVGGAKNAVLKCLAASILFDDVVTLHNVPVIEDVGRISELLRAAGATVNSTDPHQLEVTPPTEWNPVLDKSIAERLRASIVFTGPLLARTGSVSFPFPGGCVLGERPIDLFLQGFEAMGAGVAEDSEGYFTVTSPGKLKGAHIIFPFVSVTATETLMLAAVLAQGETILENSAMEPEIYSLATFLNSCGAHIKGMGTSVIRITGGGLLHAAGEVYTTPPDRIETGSFMLLAALAGRSVTVTNCEPKHVGALISILQKAGVPLSVGQDSITITAGDIPNEAFKSVSVRTHEYPGFPTDLQAPMAVFLTQTTGESTILETIFDGRFRYADELIRMGADITIMNPHKILIRGPRHFTDKNLESPDLRAGLAYLLAAIVAEGTSTIENIYLIDRGYEHIEERLSRLGLNIKRVAA